MITTLNGKRISFKELINDSKWSIQIPMIQRDFAYGRQNQIVAASGFVESLLNAMTNYETVELDLNFIYGSTNKTEDFLIIDGQQRLTVLFLLHWYLAGLQDEFIEFKKVLLKNSRTRFLYQTRASASEFTNAIIASFSNLAELITSSATGKVLKKSIKNQPWFLKSWNSDPTVIAMLSLIEIIHDFSLINQIKDKNIYFDRVTFQILDIESYALTDELYIKMNARGKPLSDWQNFKAYIYEFIKEEKVSVIINDRKEALVKKENIIINDWEEALDKRWLDFFWTNTENKENVEENMLIYFRNMLLFQFADDKNDFGENEKQILPQLLNEIEGGMVNFCKSLQLLSVNYLNRCFLGLESLLNINIDQFDTYLKESLPSHFTEYNLKSFLFRNKSTIGLYDRSYFNAVLTGLRLAKKTSQPMLGNLTNRWLRVTRNLIFNQNIDNNLRLFNTLKAIATIENRGIYDIDTYPLQELTTGFTKIQINDELKKNELIKQNEEVKKLIYKLEDHYYLYGQINFIIEMSTDVSGILNLSEVQNLGEKLCTLIDENCKNDHYLLQRALLTKGFCFGNRGGNHTLCLWKHNSARDRNENWRTVFNDPRKRQYLKELLEDPRSLEEIIKNSTVLNWRRNFIEYPQIYKYATEGLIRKFSDCNIRILKTTSIGGRQGELKTLSLFYEFFKNKITEFYPFTNTGYATKIGQASYPCIYLDGWIFDTDSDYALDIFSNLDDIYFSFRFFNRNSTLIAEIIKDKLLENNFVEYQNNEVEGYLLIVKQEDIFIKLMQILNDFKSI